MIFTLDKQIWFKIATPCLVANYENSHKMTFQISMGIVQRIHRTQKTKYNVENLNCAFRVYVVLKGGGVNQSFFSTRKRGSNFPLILYTAPF